MLKRWWMVAWAVGLGVGACSSDDEGPKGSSETEEPVKSGDEFVPEVRACDDDTLVSFNALYETMATSCVSIGCHSSSTPTSVLGGNMMSPAAGNLDLSTSVAAYASFLGKAQGCEGDVVVPGDPDKSVLIAKLEGTSCGARMPQNADPMPKAFIDEVRKWIKQGAPIDVPNNCGVVEASKAEGPTFTEVYEKVLRPSCGGLWCHNPYQSPDEKRLDVSAKDKAYIDLVNARAVCMGEGSELLRVKPGDAENSMLIAKLEDRACGLPMPVDVTGTYQPLSPELIQLVKDWINAGAANN